MPKSRARVQSEPVKVTCPKCGQPSLWTGNRFRPFCSERCKILDLGGWAAEKYKVEMEGEEPSPDHEAETGAWPADKKTEDN